MTNARCLRAALTGFTRMCRCTVNGPKVCVIHIGHPEIVSWACGIRTIFLIQILFADLRQVQEKNGSSGRTRTYNPPVNSRMLCH
jgi:hypothetical protein